MKTTVWKKGVALALSALLLVGLCACSARSSEDVLTETTSASSKDNSYGQGGVSTPGMDAGWVGETAAQDPTSGTSGSISATDVTAQNDKLIYSATLALETTEFDSVAAALGQLAKQLGGYVQSSTLYQGSYGYNGSRSASYIFRIPADQYQAFLDAAGQAAHLTSQNEWVDNVSEEYYDIEARLETLQAKRERLLALLEKAEDIESMITVENSLADTVYQIEQYQTRLNSLDKSVSYSTFNVTLSEVYQLSVVDQTPKSLSERLSQALHNGLTNAGKFLENLAVFLAYNLIGIAMLVLVLIIVLIVLAGGSRNRKRRKEVRTPPPQSENKAE